MKYETVLSKDYSNMVKGMAILMMIMHHIWGFPEKIPGLLLSNIEVQIGSAAKICVSIFMFLSGYGLYYTFEKKKPFGFGIGSGMYISAFGRCS